MTVPWALRTVLWIWLPVAWRAQSFLAQSSSSFSARCSHTCPSTPQDRKRLTAREVHTRDSSVGNYTKWKSLWNTNRFGLYACFEPEKHDPMRKPAPHEASWWGRGKQRGSVAGCPPHTHWPLAEGLAVASQTEVGWAGEVHVSRLAVREPCVKKKIKKQESRWDTDAKHVYLISRCSSPTIRRLSTLAKK